MASPGPVGLSSPSTGSSTTSPTSSSSPTNSAQNFHTAIQDLEKALKALGFSLPNSGTTTTTTTTTSTV